VSPLLSLWLPVHFLTNTAAFSTLLSATLHSARTLSIRIPRDTKHQHTHLQTQVTRCGEVYTDTPDTLPSRGASYHNRPSATTKSPGRTGARSTAASAKLRSGAARSSSGAPASSSPAAAAAALHAAKVDATLPFAYDAPRPAASTSPEPTPMAAAWTPARGGATAGQQRQQQQSASPSPVVAVAGSPAGKISLRKTHHQTVAGGGRLGF